MGNIAISFCILLSISTSIASGQPTITSFTPTNGPIGTLVTITGTNFDPTPTNNIVFFGATQATVSTFTAIELTVTVPVGATYEPITVLANGLLAYSSAPFVVTFAGGTIDSNSFATKVDFATGLVPGSVAIGDLDGDGKADLAVGNVNSHTVSLFRNTSTSEGNISYAAKIDYTTGTNPRSVAIGDLDGDGKPDLAVANFGSNNVSVFRNTSTSIGTISYSPKVDYTAGIDPQSVAIGDLDGDGRADLVVGNRDNKEISVLRNTTTGVGTIGFDPKVVFTAGEGPQSVSIGDLDGDGKVDLAIANFNTVSVLRNTSPGAGTISFAPTVDFPTGHSSWSVAIGDLDGDGKADLAVANNNSDSISVLRNTSTSVGTISYATKVDYLTGTGPSSVSISDLDGDGKLDLAVANFIGNTVSVYRNTSPSVGTISYDPKVDFATGTAPRGISIGDFDGDGKADLVAANSSNTTVSVLRNTTKIASSETDITAFSLAEQTGTATIDETDHTIEIEVAACTDVANLIASFSLSDGATAEVSGITQVSGSSVNDFTGPVVYVVQSEDGSKFQNWIITVSIQDIEIELVVETTDQTSCEPPNGAAEIIDILINNESTDIIESDYSVEWSSDTNFENIIGIAFQQSDLSSGAYFVRATNNVLGCNSTVSSFEISDNTIDPNVSISVNQKDIAATEILEGSLSASIDGETEGYTFIWYAGDTIVEPSIGSGPVIDSLSSGVYSVLVTDTLEPNLGCHAIQTATVELDDRLEQEITFNLPEELFLDESPFSLEATSTSQLEVEFEMVSGTATIENGALILLDTGTIVVRAFQTGDDVYLPTELLKESQLKGIFTFGGIVTEPSTDSLATGLAKLFRSTGGLAYQTDVTNGVFQIDSVREGEYILHIVPTGNATSDVFHTYYLDHLFWQDADVITIEDDFSISMVMASKESKDNHGQGKLRGTVVDSETSNGGRLQNVPLSDVVVYLVDSLTEEIIADAVTDVNGIFEMEGLESGTYELKIEIVGAEITGLDAVIEIDQSGDIIELTVEVNGDQINIEVQRILGIEEFDIAMRMYPNPTKDFFTIEIIMGMTAIRIYNSLGAIVFEKKLFGSRTETIDFSNQMNGLYFVQVSTQKEVKIDRIIKY